MELHCLIMFGKLVSMQEELDAEAEDADLNAAWEPLRKLHLGPDLKQMQVCFSENLFPSFTQRPVHTPVQLDVQSMCPSWLHLECLS